MLLMSTAFRPGECLNFIQNLKNQDMQKMAYCEYYYFTGEHDKAVDLAELYLSHPDPMLRLSACLIYTFANLSLNRINSATGGLKSLKENLDQILKRKIIGRLPHSQFLQPLPHKRSFIFQSEMFLLCQTISLNCLLE